LALITSEGRSKGRPLTRVFCVTGPESSGKTTLARSLASHFSGSWLPEYARYYLTSPEYDEEALHKISREQYARECAFVRSDPHIGFIDTDLINIRIWWDVRFGRVPDWIDSSLLNQQKRYYLLLKPDLPWQDDPLRDQTLDRDYLFTQHKELLERFSLPYEVVHGVGQERYQCAIAKVGRLLDMNKTVED